MDFFKRGFKAAKSALFGDDNGNADSDGGYGSERAGGGFAHKREVVVERPKMPVVQYAVSRYGGEPMGGIQGLWWYAKSLLCDDDDDGDVADQFLVEPQPGDARGLARERGGEGAGGPGDQGIDGGGGEERDEEEVKISYSHALVEVKGVSKGNVLLSPINLD